MSADPDATRCRILREGYLDVKAPPDSPERILHKAWRRLWVICAIFIPKGRGEPHLILEIYRKAADHPLKRVKASRDGLRLFRCNSGSRPLRTWALSSGSSLLVYLAAETEGETQDWMGTIRDGLWPPINTALSGECHDVSLIDDEKSFASGLLGVYGRLVKTSDESMSVLHPHWHGTQMRWLLADIASVKLVRKIRDGDAGVFCLSVNSSKKETRTLHFYSKTAIETVEWIRFILKDLKSPGESKTTKGKDKTESLPVNRTPDPVTTYAVVQKIPQELQKTETKTSVSDDSSHKDKPATYFHVGHFPSTFLDASMNSALPKTDGNASPKEVKSGRSSTPDLDSDDDEEAFAEVYDHIYEDLSPVRTNRSDTVYEEVDDAETEYMSPMPPTPPSRAKPVPPERPSVLQLQTSIPGPIDPRLQKLSESVTEALKLAVESAQKPVEIRAGLRRKVSKKSKSLQHSPTVEVKPLPVVTPECHLVVHRAHSESNIKDTSPHSDAWPLRPFNVSPAATNMQQPEWEAQLAKEVKTQPPLSDLLKSLHANSDLPTSPTDETKTLIWKAREIPQLHITNAEAPSSPSGTEAEYIDMR